MKYTICSIALLASIFVGGLLSARYIDRSVSETLALLEQAEEAAEAKQSAQCLILLENAENRWNEHKTWFGVFLQHDEMDQVLEQFAQAHVYAGEEDTTEFLSTCAALKARLHHIREMERPAVHNIM